MGAKVDRGTLAGATVELVRRNDLLSDDRSYLNLVDYLQFAV